MAIKIDDLRKKSIEELINLKKEIEFAKTKASIGSINNKENKKLGIKGTEKKGAKTSMQKDLKRLYAKIKTIIKEKGGQNEK